MTRELHVLTEHEIECIEKFRDAALKKGYRIVGETMVQNDIPSLIYTIRELRKAQEPEKPPLMLVDTQTGEIKEVKKPPLKVEAEPEPEPMPEAPPEEYDPFADDAREGEPWWCNNND